MKVLIYCLWFFCLVCIQVIFKNIGVLLGALPTALLYLLVWFCADKTWYAWKQHTVLKEAQKAGKTPFEFIANDVPESVIEYCNSVRGNVAEVKDYLKACVKNKSITDLESRILFEEFKTPRLLSAENHGKPILFCRECGTKLLGNSSFCQKCGTKIITPEEIK